MTTTTTVLIDAKDAPTSQTTEYTSSDVKTIIDKFTAHNTTGGNLTYAVNLVPTGSSASATNLILNRTILAGQTYTCPELVGQTLNAGDFISDIAGGAGLTIRASGRQITES